MKKRIPGDIKAGEISQNIDTVEKRGEEKKSLNQHNVFHCVIVKWNYVFKSNFFETKHFSGQFE